MVNVAERERIKDFEEGTYKLNRVDNIKYAEITEEYLIIGDGMNVDVIELEQEIEIKEDGIFIEGIKGVYKLD